MIIIFITSEICDFVTIPSACEIILWITDYKYGMLVGKQGCSNTQPDFLHAYLHISL
jgi:hypothetical protein